MKEEKFKQFQDEMVKCISKKFSIPEELLRRKVDLDPESLALRELKKVYVMKGASGSMDPVKEFKINGTVYPVQSLAESEMEKNIIPYFGRELSEDEKIITEATEAASSPSFETVTKEANKP